MVCFKDLCVLLMFSRKSYSSFGRCFGPVDLNDFQVFKLFHVSCEQIKIVGTDCVWAPAKVVDSISHVTKIVGGRFGGTVVSPKSVDISLEICLCLLSSEILASKSLIFR